MDENVVKVEDESDVSVDDTCDDFLVVCNVVQ